MVNQYVKGVIFLIVIGSILAIYIIGLDMFANTITQKESKVEMILERNNTTAKGLIPQTLSDFEHPIDYISGVQRFSTEVQNGS